MISLAKSILKIVLIQSIFFLWLIDQVTKELTSGQLWYQLLHWSFLFDIYRNKGGLTEKLFPDKNMLSFNCPVQRVIAHQIWHSPNAINYIQLEVYIESSREHIPALNQPGRLNGCYFAGGTFKSIFLYETGYFVHHIPLTKVTS